MRNTYATRNVAQRTQLLSIGISDVFIGWYIYWVGGSTGFAVFRADLTGGREMSGREREGGRELIGGEGEKIGREWRLPPAYRLAKAPLAGSSRELFGQGLPRQCTVFLSSLPPSSFFSIPYSLTQCPPLSLFFPIPPTISSPLPSLPSLLLPTRLSLSSPFFRKKIKKDFVFFLSSEGLVRYIDMAIWGAISGLKV